MINNQLRQDIDKYINNMMAMNTYSKQKGYNETISRVQAYRILKKAAENVGLKEIGTHTLRKHLDIGTINDIRCCTVIGII